MKLNWLSATLCWASAFQHVECYSKFKIDCIFMQMPVKSPAVISLMHQHNVWISIICSLLFSPFRISVKHLRCQMFSQILLKRQRKKKRFILRTTGYSSENCSHSSELLLTLFYFLLEVFRNVFKSENIDSVLFPAKWQRQASRWTAAQMCDLWLKLFGWGRSIACAELTCSLYGYYLRAKPCIPITRQPYGCLSHY